MPAAADAPTATIVVPTRGRPSYLARALDSIAPQAAAAGAEVLVVDDAGASEGVRALCGRVGARYLPHEVPLGLNPARNTGVAAARGELVVFVDDDVEVRPGWLAALLAAASEHPDVDVFTGPIHARLEGSPPRSCGREPAPITALDLGPRDAFARFAWGANMAIRRPALDRVGAFDTTLANGGDEQEWQERAQAPGRALYVAGAALDHRREPPDARLAPLCRAAYARGRAAERFDAWRGQAPPLRHELRTLAGCAGHVVRRRCPMGLTMVAHSWGRVLASFTAAAASGAHSRLQQQRDGAIGDEDRAPPLRQENGTLENDRRQSPRPDGSDENNHTSPRASERAADDFLSGESGTVGGLDELRRAAIDARDDALQLARGRSMRLRRAARRSPASRNVLALCVERPQNGRLVDAIAAELSRSRHRVELRRGGAGAAGKFENLNRLLGGGEERGGANLDLASLERLDWLLVLDDDISLPHGFLDRFLFLAERFRLDLAQPAHRAVSHAAWRVTRRHRDAVVRETRFVEIGPATAFSRRTFHTLLPFPTLRMGWGLDLHWAALAAQHGWRCGVLDAVAIAHRQAPAAAAYSRERALAEAREFLRERPYLRAAEAQLTLTTHRRW